MPTRCTGRTAAGRACRAWAVRGSDPPRCKAHAEPGADELSAQIDDLDARIARLGEYVDARREELAVGDLVRLLDLHSKMLERVTRMRQAKSDLDGKQSALMAATHVVLDDIAKEKGIEL